jgi:hypothetical protein
MDDYSIRSDHKFCSDSISLFPLRLKPLLAHRWRYYACAREVLDAQIPNERTMWRNCIMTKKILAYMYQEIVIGGCNFIYLGVLPTVCRDADIGIHHSTYLLPWIADEIWPYCIELRFRHLKYPCDRCLRKGCAVIEIADGKTCCLSDVAWSDVTVFASAILDSRFLCEICHDFHTQTMQCSKKYLKSTTIVNHLNFPRIKRCSQISTQKKITLRSAIRKI